MARRRRGLAAALVGILVLPAPLPARPLPPADPTDAAAPPAAGPAAAPLRLAQATPVPDVRMAAFAQRVLEALAALATEDQRTAGSGLVLDERVTAALRSALERYVQAGERSGLNRADMEALLANAYAERYSGPVPAALLDAEGRLDVRGLLAGTIGRSRPETERKVDPAYLAAITAEGERVLAESRRRPAAPAPAAPGAPDLPDAGGDPAIAAVQARVTRDGAGRWITVAQGDSLGLIARAVYGDALAYRRIFEANRDILNDPNVLRVNLRLRLPAP